VQNALLRCVLLACLQ